MPDYYDHPDAQNHIEDSHMGVTATGLSYAKAMAGQGRWCDLEAPLGLKVGVMWTDDRDSLGFIPVQVNQNENAPQFASAFGASIDQAAELGVASSVVFDSWAERATQGLAAREIHSGDLATLYRDTV